MITTVLFDIGEVLFQGFYGFENLVSKSLGIEVADESLQTSELHRFFCGTITEDALWGQMIGRFGWNVDVQDLKTLVRQNFTEIPGTLNIVRHLKGRIHKLGILSVHGKEWIKWIDARTPFIHLFDHAEISYNCGVCKPDPYAFFGALNGLQVPASSCLFVDDNAVNIRVAQELGFHTHRFESALLLRHDLESQGLLS